MNKKRKQLILVTALELALKYGLVGFNIEDIARSSKLSKSIIRSHFGGIKRIRAEIYKYALKKNIKPIINTPVLDIIRA